MDWIRFRGALIRAFWTVIMPLIGAGVVYLLEPGKIEEFGVTNGGAILIIGGILYGLKKLFFPNTTL